VTSRLGTGKMLTFFYNDTLTKIFADKMADIAPKVRKHFFLEPKSPAPPSVKINKEDF
jgi:hypothetical protein